MKGICAVLAGLLLLCMTGCAKQAPAAPPQPTKAPAAAPSAEPIVPETPAPQNSGEPHDGKLMCLADSLEEAQEIAALYGITLVNFSGGIATFDTDEDANTVIARGKQKGWPALSINGTVYAVSG